MGSAISTVIESKTTNDENERRQREQLELIFKLADARLDTMQRELEQTFLDRETTIKRSVPGRRALRFERRIAVDAETTVEYAVDSFLGASETTTQYFRDGLKSVVKSGLSPILGDSSTGESYDKKFFVCVKHNALIRIDMSTYKYTFASQGLVGEHKNVLAYLLCISVIDHRDVTSDELVYLASEFAGDGDVGQGSSFQGYMDAILKTWNALRAVDPLPTPGRPHIDYPGLSIPARPSV
ncbi:hypothetical protein IQ07DRAFT_521398 [Pyrenochaeta sp. DS3sAY3a]|nr:hypothetical protein IQ07DRAFT_521398 [Pyrenochaeta sp. DS3sAY3a]